jgi:hypothetical protein
LLCYDRDSDFGPGKSRSDNHLANPCWDLRLAMCSGMEASWPGTRHTDATLEAWRQQRRCLRVSIPSWGRCYGHPLHATASGENPYPLRSQRRWYRVRRYPLGGVVVEPRLYLLLFLCFRLASFGFSCFLLIIFYLLCKRFSSPPCIGLTVVVLFIQYGIKAGRKPMILFCC